MYGGYCCGMLSTTNHSFVCVSLLGIVLNLVRLCFISYFCFVLYYRLDSRIISLPGYLTVLSFRHFASINYLSNSADVKSKSARAVYFRSTTMEGNCA